MRILVHESEAAVAHAAADLLTAQVAARRDLVIGLPTGRTMIALYDELATRHARGQLDLSRARGFNLDELVLPPGHPQSFAAYMSHHAGERIGLRAERCAIPTPTSIEREALDVECARYERSLAAAGGLDLAILGVGADGHVAYNLPGPPRLATHVVNLPDELATSLAVPREYRPLRAITLGLGAFLEARRIVLLATGLDKVATLRALQRGERDEQWPCTLLLGHALFEVVVTAELERAL